MCENWIIVRGSAVVCRNCKGKVAFRSADPEDVISLVEEVGWSISKKVMTEIEGLRNQLTLHTHNVPLPSPFLPQEGFKTTRPDCPIPKSFYFPSHKESKLDPNRNFNTVKRDTEAKR